MVVIHLLTIFAAWSTPTVRAIIGKIESGIIPKLRDQMEAHLSDHVHGIVMTEFPIEQKLTFPLCYFGQISCCFPKRTA